MAVPTFMSLLLYLSALHNTDTDKEREEKKCTDSTPEQYYC